MLYNEERQQKGEKKDTDHYLGIEDDIHNTREYWHIYKAVNTTFIIHLLVASQSKTHKPGKFICREC